MSDIKIGFPFTAFPNQIIDEKLSDIDVSSFSKSLVNTNAIVSSAILTDGFPPVFTKLNII